MTIDIYYICCANIYMCLHLCVCLVVYSLHGHEHVQKEGRIPLQLAPYCTNCQRLRVSLSVCVRLCVVFARCGSSLLLYKHEARLDTNYTTAFKVGVVARSGNLRTLPRLLLLLLLLLPMLLLLCIHKLQARSIFRQQQMQ